MSDSSPAHAITRVVDDLFDERVEPASLGWVRKSVALFMADLCCTEAH